MNNIFLSIQLLYCRIFQQALFTIKIENGNATRISGFVRTSFMFDCIDIVARENIQSGLIYAVKGTYGKPVVKVYGKISTGILQQLRNAWNFNA